MHLRLITLIVLTVSLLGCDKESSPGADSTAATTNPKPSGDVTSEGYETVQWEGFFNPSTFIVEDEERTESLTFADDHSVIVTVTPTDEDQEPTVVNGSWGRIYDGVRIDLPGEGGELGGVQRYFKGLEMEDLTEKETGQVFVRQTSEE